MIRLEYTNENGERIEVPLVEGKLTVGRNPSNDIHLPHDSVSGFHCEIETTPTSSVVRDLGSANGTLINDEPVTEHVLHPGQCLTVGDLALAIADTKHAAIPTIAGAPGSAPSPHRLQRTPVAAKGKLVYCTRCKTSHPIEATRQVSAGMSIVNFCPTCNERCISEAERVKRFERKETKTFGQHISAAFSYPFRDNGWMILITGTIVFTIVDVLKFVASHAPIFGWAAVGILGFFSITYVYVFLKHVIADSARGEDSPPSWPELTNVFSDLFLPFWQLVGMILLCALPALIVPGLVPDSLKPITVVSFFVFGLLYFPMGLLAVTQYDTIAALNPLLILNSIARILGHYLVTCVILLILLVVQGASGMLADNTTLYLITLPIAQFASIYLLVVMGRVLGIMYFVNQRRLGWFT